LFVVPVFYVVMKSLVSRFNDDPDGAPSLS
jgi:hypothetical protein